MARRSLRPELNRIRAWVRQGRTDAWIAHQLEVAVQEIQTFKRDHGLNEGQEAEAVGVTATDYDDEIDLRAEDDALIAAELEAAETRRIEPDPESAEEDEESPEPETRRRRGRRGGRGRGRGRRAT